MKYSVAALSIVAVALSACGGGGGSSPTMNPVTPTSAQGLWNGTTSSGRSIAGLVLDDGTYWFIYTAVGNNAVIAGAVQGHGTSSNGAFTSSDGIDFNLEGLGSNGFSLSGTYTDKSTLGGTQTYTTGGSGTFTTTYSTDYELAPCLATVAGTYSGTAATLGGTELTTVTISSTGAISGSSASGCAYSGTASTRAKGNVYDVSVTFNGGVCSNGTTTVTGAAYYVLTSKRLISAALNTGRTNGFLFEGTKP